MEPKEFFKKKQIGKLITRTIDRLSLDGVPASIKDEKEYEVIDIHTIHSEKMYVTNTWENPNLQVVLAIHNSLVKEYIPNEQ